MNWRAKNKNLISSENQDLSDRYYKNTLISREILVKMNDLSGLGVRMARRWSYKL